MKIVTYKDERVVEAIPALSALRRSVFAEWPYLYDGDDESEADYFTGFASARDALIVAALDQDGEVIAASSGCALVDHEDGKGVDLSVHGIDPETVFYCAESVALPAARGQGLGHAFFDAREAHALARSYQWSVFCSVQRPEDHPMKPEGARDLAPFWRGRSYSPLLGAEATFAWRDIGDAAESEKVLAYWAKDLRAE